MDKEIAITVIKQMSSHIDLLFTLSMAVCGALAAGILQILIHNSQSDKVTIRLSRMSLLYWAFFVQSISLLFGYLARGSVTAVTPIIFNYDKTVGNWADVPFEGHTTLRICMIAQFLTLVAGVFVILAFVLANKNVLMKGDKT